jgi:hypothetical protein
MGCGASSADDVKSVKANGPAKREKAASRGIDAKLAAEAEADAQVTKLLLLGAGESGKSTIFKQLNFIYNHTLSGVNERKPFVPVIYNNLIGAMKVLIDYTQSAKVSLADDKTSDAAQRILAVRLSFLPTLSADSCSPTSSLH